MECTKLVQVHQNGQPLKTQRGCINSAVGQLECAVEAQMLSKALTDAQIKPFPVDYSAVWAYESVPSMLVK
eukprot:CAMPEP_0172538904 /NCGR_PEP_ID=MMETSP1067-20121228/10206_1 /TAXON_ID=265564 ORGANISM="Thalassiosira punctigera, Strain Tpunct2005C2" /NCGR_SAMPLE_ID=MMETSP1067 /ASSEMBLY_ACC=CAM_ASM_000444 /LENGTH=70 /DNA_ID=CAMNT_0013324495 /DNA_START=26 /DNA_END=238 /DNA_ORIENTATION=-